MNNLDQKINTPSDNWATRGDYWIKRLNPTPQYKARKRRIIHKPLVLSGHGIRLKVNSGTLLITCGFTHYPQKREEYRFFPQDRQLPSRIVILDGDGSITMDALKWLSEQGVPLVQLDWRGETSSIGGAAYAAKPEIANKQFEMQNNGQGLAYSIKLIEEKTKYSIKTIKSISNNSIEAKSYIQKINEHKSAFIKNPPNTIIELMNIESIMAAAYFRYWYTLNLRWKGTNRKPIPEDWNRVGTRIGKSSTNQHAVHPVNAILNYAYGILENQIRNLILLQGADPSIGFLHKPGRNNSALVYDLMEPVRPVMDKKILTFVLERTLSPDDFILNKEGVVRLHPQMARFIVKLVQDIPEIEKITQNNINKLFF